MTTTGRGSHRAYDSDRDRLLDVVGRAGTPPVDETTFRVDPLALTGHDQTRPPAHCPGPSSLRRCSSWHATR